MNFFKNNDPNITWILLPETFFLKYHVKRYRSVCGGCTPTLLTGSYSHEKQNQKQTSKIKFRSKDQNGRSALL